MMNDVQKMAEISYDRKMMKQINRSIVHAYSQYEVAKNAENRIIHPLEEISIGMDLIMIVLLILQIAEGIQTEVRYIISLLLLIGLLIVSMGITYWIHQRNMNEQIYAADSYAIGDEILQKNLYCLELIPNTYWFPFATEHMVQHLCDDPQASIKSCLIECREYLKRCKTDPAYQELLEHQCSYLDHILEQKWSSL